MKICRFVFISFLLIISLQKGFSTAQIPDILIYKGDTFSVYLPYLPDEFYKLDTVIFDSIEYINRVLTVDLFAKKTCISTDCGREYQARWEINDDQLYLTGIYSCCYYHDSIKADLKTLFKDKFVNGKVKVDWLTTKIYYPEGKFLIHVEGMSIYERDIELEFENGKLISIKTLDNSQTKQSQYSQSQEKLNEFIYSNIHWEQLPKLDSTVRVVVQIVPNEDGVIENVEVARGNNDAFNQEAIRVVKMIPDWDVYIFRGKHIRVLWNIPVIFSEDNRKTYGR